MPGRNVTSCRRERVCFRFAEVWNTATRGAAVDGGVAFATGTPGTSAIAKLAATGSSRRLTACILAQEAGWGLSPRGLPVGHAAGQRYGRAFADPGR